MAYIVDGFLLRGGQKLYYVDLWREDDPDTAYEFHEVATKEEQKRLIRKFEAAGHTRAEDEQYGE